MRNIVALGQCLRPSITATPIGQLSRIILALLVITGRITMLGLSRWAGSGGSYRTIQRFFSTVLPWGTLFWVFFRHPLSRAADVYLLAGDEVVGTKAGQTTPGRDRFFSRLDGKPVPGLACFALSLISVQARRSVPIRGEQVVRREAGKAASKAQAPAKKRPASPPQRRPGRPRGSLNTPKTPVALTPALVRLKAMLDALLHLLAKVCPLTYLVLDGHCGHHNALPRAPQATLPLISTLRCDAALYAPYPGP